MFDPCYMAYFTTASSNSSLSSATSSSINFAFYLAFSLPILLLCVHHSQSRFHKTCLLYFLVNMVLNIVNITHSKLQNMTATWDQIFSKLLTVTTLTLRRITAGFKLDASINANMTFSITLIGLTNIGEYGTMRNHQAIHELEHQCVPTEHSWKCEMSRNHSKTLQQLS